MAGSAVDGLVEVRARVIGVGATPVVSVSVFGTFTVSFDLSLSQGCDTWVVLLFCPGV